MIDHKELYEAPDYVSEAAKDLITGKPMPSKITIIEHEQIKELQAENDRLKRDLEEATHIIKEGLKLVEDFQKAALSCDSAGELEDIRPEHIKEEIASLNTELMVSSAMEKVGEEECARLRQENSFLKGQLKYMKSPAESCREERAKGAGGCGACSICCGEMKARAEMAEAERDRARLLLEAGKAGHDTIEERIEQASSEGWIAMEGVKRERNEARMHLAMVVDAAENADHGPRGTPAYEPECALCNALEAVKSNVNVPGDANAVRMTRKRAEKAEADLHEAQTKLGEAYRKIMRIRDVAESLIDYRMNPNSPGWLPDRSRYAALKRVIGSEPAKDMVVTTREELRSFGEDVMRESFRLFDDEPGEWTATEVVEIPLFRMLQEREWKNG